MLLINMALILLVFIAYRIKKKMSSKTINVFSNILWGIFPMLIYVLGEYILGNLLTITVFNHLKNILVYYVGYFLFTIIINHLWGVFVGYGGLIMILTLIQYYTTFFRGRPLYIHDLYAAKTALTVVANYRFSFDKKIFVCVLFFVLLICLGVIFSKRIIGENKQRICGSTVCAVVILLMCMFGSRWLVTVNMWDISATYQRTGNVLTMLSQIPYMIIQPPENYSVAKVETLAEAYKKKEDKPKEQPINIIMIMNESFADLEYLSEIATDTELLPNWRLIQENCIKGYLYIPVFGAGTSNSEYEVLTGNELEFMAQGTTAYQMNVKDHEKSLVSILEEQGFKTSALHPYPAENWNRENVYNYMGFDSFYAENNWGEMEILRWVASDKSAYKKVIEIDEESTEKQFIFLVTMQNHGGYTVQWEEFENDVLLNYNSEYPQAEQFLSLMQESDKALKKLLEYYEKSSESTMIALFGDHQPAVEEEFYEELYGKELQELSFEEKQSRYVTPFIIWANYEIEEQNGVEISSNYLGSYVLEQAGVELTPYNRFLLKVMDEVPVIGIGGIKTKEGNWYKWEGLPSVYGELMENYKILQYNNIYDRKNRVESMFSIN